MSLNMNLEQYGRLFLNNTEQSELQVSTGRWQRAIPCSTVRGLLARFANTRKTGGDGTIYPAFSAKTVLPSVKVFGKTEKTIVIDGVPYAIPSDVELVDSLTNGASTKINTGIYASDNIEYFIRTKCNTTGSYYLFQARSGSSGIIYGVSGSSSGATFSAHGTTIPGIARTIGHIYAISLKIQNGAVTYTVLDETTGDTGTATGTTSSLVSPTTICLFGAANYLDAGEQVYEAWIKKNGTMVWYMCGAKKNNVVGVFNPINGQFTTPKGTLTAGAVKPVELYGVGDKIYGVPNEYDVVEYIESSGTQYINTLLEGKNGYTLETKVRYTEVPLEYTYIAGFGNASSNRIYFTRAYKIDSKITNGYTFDGHPTSVSSSKISLNTDYTYKSIMETGKQECYVNGSLIVSGTYRVQNAYGTVYLFATNYSGSSNGALTGRMYYAQFYFDGRLVRDFIPVKNKFTNEYGMYDLVSKRFYGNAGTGAFTGGAVVPNYSIDVNAGKQGETPVKHSVVLSKQLHRITPALNGYDLVEYIASNGEQYINTDILPTSTTKCELTFKVNTLSNLNSNVFGSYVRNASFYFAARTDRFHASIGNGEARISPSDTNKHNAILDTANRTFTLDGTEYSSTASSFGTNTYPIHLFEQNGTIIGDLSTGAICNIYSFKIYDNDVLVRDFIPVKKKSNNEYGMYDTVSGQFFGNSSGKGSFTGGDVIPSSAVEDSIDFQSGVLTTKIGSRAYQTGDESNPTVVTDGTTTLYILATPTTEEVVTEAISLAKKAEHILENVNFIKGDVQVVYIGKE